jgi:hypothetical protein
MEQFARPGRPKQQQGKRPGAANHRQKIDTAIRTALKKSEPALVKYHPDWA